MAYKIGQIRKSTSTSYMTDVNASETAFKTIGFSQKVFNDLALNTSFSAKNTYYLRFRIKRKEDANLIVTLGLYKTNDGNYKTGDYQTLDSFEVEQYVEGVTGEYANFELLFTPDDTYNYLAFILTRGSKDYLEDIPTQIDELDWSGDNGDFAIVNNILPVKATKIGFQSRPGALLTVNNESIRLGRSGVYEVNNGVEISNVGVAAPNGEIDSFILDYAYED